MNAVQSILPVSRKSFESQRVIYELQLDESRSQIRTLQRKQDRLMARTFAAAQMNRLTQDFITTWHSIDQDIRQGGKVLVARSRALVQNNPVAQRFMQLYITNVIGHNGHTFQPNVSDRVLENVKGKQKLLSKPDVLANTKILESWMDWTRPGNCTVDGRHSFAGASKLIGRSKVRDGESFIRLVVDTTEKHPLRIQVIPTEAIDFELTGRLRNGNVIIMGVELNPWRRPVAYYVRKVRPELEVYGWTNYSSDYERIPAGELIHWFDQEYYNQTRGITKFAQVMLLLHDLDRYEKAVVVNATASAAKMGFFSDKEQEQEELVGDSTDADGNIVIEAEAGSFHDIGNKDFKPWDPKFPTQQYEMYIRGLTRRVAGGLGVAYSSLGNDYGEANYSSLKAELLVERENWKAEQQSFIDNVLRPVFAKWLELEMLNGNIKLPFIKFEKFNNPVFVGPRWPWVDPLKEIQAKRMEMESLLESPFAVIGEKGESSAEQILQDIEEFNDLAKDHGLKPIFGASPKAQEMIDEEDGKPAPKKKPAQPAEEEEPETEPAGSRADLAAVLAGENGNGNHH